MSPGISVSVRRYAPSSRFSRTVIRGKQRRPSGACEIPSATILPVDMALISTPSKRIEPLRGGSSPEIERSVVDLPAPFEPIIVTTSPASTSSETPRSASIAAVVGVDVFDLEQRHAGYPSPPSPR